MFELLPGLVGLELMGPTKQALGLLEVSLDHLTLLPSLQRLVIGDPPISISPDGSVDLTPDSPTEVWSELDEDADWSLMDEADDHHDALRLVERMIMGRSTQHSDKPKTRGTPWKLRPYSSFVDQIPDMNMCPELTNVLKSRTVLNPDLGTCTAIRSVVIHATAWFGYLCSREMITQLELLQQPGADVDILVLPTRCEHVDVEREFRLGHHAVYVSCAPISLA